MDYRNLTKETSTILNREHIAIDMVDSKNRRIGLEVQTRYIKLIAFDGNDENQCWTNKEPGEYYDVYAQMTKDGMPWGSGQTGHWMAAGNINDVDAYIAKRVAQIKKNKSLTIDPNPTTIDSLVWNTKYSETTTNGLFEIGYRHNDDGVVIGRELHINKTTDFPNARLLFPDSLHYGTEAAAKADAEKIFAELKKNRAIIAKTKKFATIESREIESPTVEIKTATGRAKCRICGEKIEKGSHDVLFFHSLTEASYNSWNASECHAHPGCVNYDDIIGGMSVTDAEHFKKITAPETPVAAPESKADAHLVEMKNRPTLTESEAKLISALAENLDPGEPGYSNYDFKEIAGIAEMPIKSAKGVWGSLTQKGLAFTDDLGQDIGEIVYLSDAGYHFIPGINTDYDLEYVNPMDLVKPGSDTPAADEPKLVNPSRETRERPLIDAAVCSEVRAANFGKSIISSGRAQCRQCGRKIEKGINAIQFKHKFPASPHSPVNVQIHYGNCKYAAHKAAPAETPANDTPAPSLAGNGPENGNIFEMNVNLVDVLICENTGNGIQVIGAVQKGCKKARALGSDAAAYIERAFSDISITPVPAMEITISNWNNTLWD